MQTVIETLIARFRLALDTEVGTLIHHLNIPQHESNLARVSYCGENGLQETRKLKEIGTYAHGYGIGLKIDDLTIDFDWDANGEPDGFDGWRLYNFSLDNCPEIECSHGEVNSTENASLILRC